MAKSQSLINPRIITLTLLALAMATIIVAASHAEGLGAVTDNALNIVVQIMTTILDVIVQFIGKVLDEFVRAFHNLFA